MTDFYESKYQAVILDIDGTVWNTTGIVSVAWNKAIDQSGFSVKKVNAQMLQQEFGKPMNVIAQDLFPELSSDEREILMAHCCSEEQIALRSNEIDIVYPDVVETVKELSQFYNFYIVSNCQSGYIELTVEKTGLAPFIKDFECYGRTGKGKAENIQLLKIRNNLQNVCYVGDTQGDSDACKQAGIPFIWAAYGFGEATDYVRKINSFAELKQVLE